MATYLDFENGIKQIDEDISNAKIKGDSHAVEILEKNLEKEISKTYKNLSEYQKLQLARHPDRPYALDYIRALLRDSYEIHGDRNFADDAAIVCYIGYLGSRKVVVIGEQKGRGTKNKIKRNFGMPHPEGYRKALRIAKMAEKFNLPILFLIDTPGAYPGIAAEERGQSEAIAKNLFELSRLNTKSVAVVIGEGGSGGALAIGVSDRVAMMRYSVFSVISPEGCAAILWNDPSKQENATKAMKITSEDLLHLKLIDAIVDEPLVGAHRDKENAAKALGNYFLKSLDELDKLTNEERMNKRYERITSIGAYEER
ncbi:acetyl-CoA carboxylase carboxyl transferase subunit alpha [Sulfurospirillum barnesii]|uniref:Acetyl-coenzyme A carboxylase carboxyl transferase subunit alpha n=1 Tax=Sulfurospirillum barnesii (strain ATCC 700032 / DSM 10660 / SES-3) TaxID=760154 RepID=I3XZ34_SULBS|nr:acetyl-CoA carboxylase carboxyl transferase subunit alpha [Sulfurospirillum barnesii]AFL69208.1 acetyl-CoA carboxylase, carboxyl transferase, alpha subunit [Sulfurospirillum barnesii SES-3]